MALVLLSLYPEMADAATKNVYTNAQYKVRLNYNGLLIQDMTGKSDFAQSQSLLNSMVTPVALLELDVKPSVAKGTNLSGAWFALAVTDAIGKQQCYSYVKDKQTIEFKKIRKVQGNKWRYTSPHPSGGVAAGTQYQLEVYRLYKHNTCYEVVLGAASSNRNNLDNPNSIKEYSPKKVFNILGGAFNRLQIK